MIFKYVEIRDQATCIPAVAIQMPSGDPVEELLLAPRSWLPSILWRCGYPGNGRPSVGHPYATILVRLADQRAHSDPYDWDDRTHQVAHLYVCEHFEKLRNGQVVDVCVAAELRSQLP